MKNLKQVIITIYYNWGQFHITRHAAALAYRTIFAFAPIIGLSIILLSFIIGKSLAETSVYGQIENILGIKAVSDIKNIVTASMQPGNHLIQTIFAFAILIYASTTLFIDLKNSIDDIWETKNTSTQSLIISILKQIISFSVISFAGFFLIISVVLSSIIFSKSTLLITHFKSFYLGGLLMNYMTSFIIIAFLFAFIFKYVPKQPLRWSDVYVSTVITSLLFMFGKFLLEIYLSYMNIASTFGAAGTLVGLLLWIYYSVQILFFGVLLTKILFQLKNHMMYPSV